MAFTTTDKTAYNALIDDDGSGNTGTVWSKSNVSDVLSAVDGIFSNTAGLDCNGPITERGRTLAMGAWASYTPSWTGSSTNPSLGNGSLTGRYTQIGKVVLFSVVLTAGSTTTYGSGFWTFTLPIAVGTSG